MSVGEQLNSNKPPEKGENTILSASTTRMRSFKFTLELLFFFFLSQSTLIPPKSFVFLLLQYFSKAVAATFLSRQQDSVGSF